MKTLTSKISTGVLALSIIVLGGIAPASAVTVYHGNSYWGPSNGYTQVKYCWHDYNWWEETFQGERDGYEVCSLRYV